MIEYIMPLSIKRVKDELNIELEELEEHLSMFDIETMIELKTIFSNVINKPILTDVINMNVLSIGENEITYDGTVVYIPDEDIEHIREKNLAIIYAILSAYVRFYNENSDIEVLDETILNNYIQLKAKTKYL